MIGKLFRSALLVQLLTSLCVVSAQNCTEYIGKFSKCDIEDAFGFERGSFQTDPEHPLFTENFWATYLGVPLLFGGSSSLISYSTLTENFPNFPFYGFPVFQYNKDQLFERFVFGCVYTPFGGGDKTTIDALEAAGMREYCEAGIGLTYHYKIIGYVNETTRIISRGLDVDSLEYMTEFVFQQVTQDFPVIGENSYGYYFGGPNFGGWDGYADPPELLEIRPVPEDAMWPGNLGKNWVTMDVGNIEDTCPDWWCGVMSNPAIPNPLAPNA
jgi:hypothetical protein